jgi:hypothetical protein
LAFCLAITITIVLTVAITGSPERTEALVRILREVGPLLRDVLSQTPWGP